MGPSSALMTSMHGVAHWGKYLSLVSSCDAYVIVGTSTKGSLPDHKGYPQFCSSKP